MMPSMMAGMMGSVIGRRAAHDGVGRPATKFMTGLRFPG